MLNSHPAIKAYSELLLEGAQGRPTWGGCKDIVFWNSYLGDAKKSSETCNEREMLFRYLGNVFQDAEGIQAVGFKLMYGQAGAFPQVWEYASANNLRVVHLVRQNLVDVELSKETAALRDVYHVRAGYEVEDVVIDFDPFDLLRRLRRQAADIASARTKLSALGFPTLEIRYEELKSDIDHYGRILDFLDVGLERSPLQSSLRAINESDHRALIKNYDQVRSALHDTEFSSMLR